MGLVRLSQLKRLFLGSPLPTAQSRHERLGRATALAVFASDALSSVAYATEEILLVLILAGTDRPQLLDPDRHRHRRPDRDRRQLVSPDDPRVPAGRRRLHREQGQPRRAGRPGRRRARCSIDYVLTVAVSVAAGVAALTSAVPGACSRIVRCSASPRSWPSRSRIFAGIRESGQPVRRADLPVHREPRRPDRLRRPRRRVRLPPEAPLSAAPARPRRGRARPGPPGVLLRLHRADRRRGGLRRRAGLQPPEAHNARIVLTWLGVILIVLFLGITFLAYDFRHHAAPGGNGGLAAGAPRLRRGFSTTSSRRSRC